MKLVQLCSSNKFYEELWTYETSSKWSEIQTDPIWKNYKQYNNDVRYVHKIIAAKGQFRVPLEFCKR